MSTSLAPAEIPHFPAAQKKRRVPFGHSVCEVTAELTADGPTVCVRWTGSRPTPAAEAHARALVADVLCAVALGAFWGAGRP